MSSCYLCTYLCPQLRGSCDLPQRTLKALEEAEAKNRRNLLANAANTADADLSVVLPGRTAVVVRKDDIGSSAHPVNLLTSDSPSSSSSSASNGTSHAGSFAHLLPALQAFAGFPRGYKLPERTSGRDLHRTDAEILLSSEEATIVRKALQASDNDDSQDGSQHLTKEETRILLRIANEVREEAKRLFSDEHADGQNVNSACPRRLVLSRVASVPTASCSCCERLGVRCVPVDGHPYRASGGSTSSSLPRISNDKNVALLAPNAPGVGLGGASLVTLGNSNQNTPLTLTGEQLFLRQKQEREESHAKWTEESAGRWKQAVKLAEEKHRQRLRREREEAVGKIVRRIAMEEDEAGDELDESGNEAGNGNSKADEDETPNEEDNALSKPNEAKQFHRRQRFCELWFEEVLKNSLSMQKAHKEERRTRRRWRWKRRQNPNQSDRVAKRLKRISDDNFLTSDPSWESEFDEDYEIRDLFTEFENEKEERERLEAEQMQNGGENEENIEDGNEDNVEEDANGDANDLVNVDNNGIESSYRERSNSFQQRELDELGVGWSDEEFRSQSESDEDRPSLSGERSAGEKENIDEKQIGGRNPDEVLEALVHGGLSGAEIKMATDRARKLARAAWEAFFPHNHNDVDAAAVSVSDGANKLAVRFAKEMAPSEIETEEQPSINVPALSEPASLNPFNEVAVVWRGWEICGAAEATQDAGSDVDDEKAVLRASLTNIIDDVFAAGSVQVQNDQVAEEGEAAGAVESEGAEKSDVNKTPDVIYAGLPTIPPDAAEPDDNNVGVDEIVEQGNVLPENRGGLSSLSLHASSVGFGQWQRQLVSSSSTRSTGGAASVNSTVNSTPVRVPRLFLQRALQTVASDFPDFFQAVGYHYNLPLVMTKVANEGQNVEGVIGWNVARSHAFIDDERENPKTQGLWPSVVSVGETCDVSDKALHCHVCRVELPAGSDVESKEDHQNDKERSTPLPTSCTICQRRFVCENPECMRQACVIPENKADFVCLHCLGCDDLCGCLENKMQLHELLLNGKFTKSIPEGLTVLSKQLPSNGFTSVYAEALEGKTEIIGRGTGALLSVSSHKVTGFDMAQKSPGEAKRKSDSSLSVEQRKKALRAEILSKMEEAVKTYDESAGIHGGRDNPARSPTVRARLTRQKRIYKSIKHALKKQIKGMAHGLERDKAKATMDDRLKSSSIDDLLFREDVELLVETTVSCLAREQRDLLKKACVAKGFDGVVSDLVGETSEPEGVNTVDSVEETMKLVDVAGNVVVKALMNLKHQNYSTDQHHSSQPGIVASIFGDSGASTELKNASEACPSSLSWSHQQHFVLTEIVLPKLRASSFAVFKSVLEVVAFCGNYKMENSNLENVEDKEKGLSLGKSAKKSEHHQAKRETSKKFLLGMRQLENAIVSCEQWRWWLFTLFGSNSPVTVQVVEDHDDCGSSLKHNASNSTPNASHKLHSYLRVMDDTVERDLSAFRRMFRFLIPRYLRTTIRQIGSSSVPSIVAKHVFWNKAVREGLVRCEIEREERDGKDAGMEKAVGNRGGDAKAAEQAAAEEEEPNMPRWIRSLLAVEMSRARQQEFYLRASKFMQVHNMATQCEICEWRNPGHGCTTDSNDDVFNVGSSSNSERAAHSSHGKSDGKSHGNKSLTRHEAEMHFFGNCHSDPAHRREWLQFELAWTTHSKAVLGRKG